MDFDNFDWRSIAGAVAPFAPKIGGLLGGNFGPLGGLIGSIAGKAIAGAFGVPATPEAVGKAIAEDPKAAARLQKLEEEHADALIAQAQVQIEALKQAGETDRTNISEVNATARAELGKVEWWHWRHLMGYSVLLQGTVIPFAVLIMAMRGDAAGAQVAINVASALIVYFVTMAGLNGYIGQDTTKLKIAGATGEVAPSATDALINSVRSIAAKVKPRG